MLTPKNTNTFNNTKIVELKQSYPVLVQEVNKLKEKVEEDGKKKEMFGECAKDLVATFMINWIKAAVAKPKLRSDLC